MSIPLNYSEITGLSTAKGLGDGADPATAGAVAIPKSVSYCLIEVEGANVRWRDVGTPTATQGHLLKDGDLMMYDHAPQRIKFIAVSGTPKVKVTFYRDTGVNSPAPMSGFKKSAAKPKKSAKTSRK